MTAVSYPTFGDAKKIANDKQLRRCVILFETKFGQVGYSSYGKDKRLCTSTQQMMDSVFDDLQKHCHEEFP